MGLLSEALLTLNQHLKTKPGLFVAKSCPIALRRVEAEDAYLPAQQNNKNIEPDIPTKPAVHRLIR